MPLSLSDFQRACLSYRLNWPGTGNDGRTLAERLDRLQAGLVSEQRIRQLIAEAILGQHPIEPPTSTEPPPTEPPPIEPTPPKSDLWIMGYYPAWEQGRLPPAEIDYSALTHVIHFALAPRPDGSLEPDGLGLTAAKATAAVAEAHKAGRKILICVGGGGYATQFRAATDTDAERARLVDGVISHADRFGYDGVDVDWEPLAAVDLVPLEKLLRELRAKLPAPKELTLIVGAFDKIHAAVARMESMLDRINIMTYTMSGPWSGWVTWHNSALLNGGARFPGTSTELSSADLAARQYLAGGVTPAKLGIGIPFYGKQWTGVTQPKQTWTTPPTVSGGETFYWQVMASYYTATRYRWDDVAKMPYLSDDAANWFLTYEDERSCAAKVEYAASSGLGAVILWQLSGGYFPDKPAGQRHPLLAAIKQAVVAVA